MAIKYHDAIGAERDGALRVAAGRSTGRARYRRAYQIFFLAWARLGLAV
jgi:hypothetical protein